jgi:hypothetical protein
MPTTTPSSPTAENPVVALELNFAIEQFCQLDQEMQRVLYEALRQGDQRLYACVGFALVRLLVKDEAALTAHANKALGTQLNGYFVGPTKEDWISRAGYFAKYFRDNLHFDGETGLVSIETVPFTSSI